MSPSAKRTVSMPVRLSVPSSPLAVLVSARLKVLQTVLEKT
jgi:hypothetical protein